MKEHQAMPETDDHKERAKTASVHAVIDRIEDGGVAVLLLEDEQKTQVELPVALLPEGCAGGDHLRITITPDRTSRAAAEARIKKLQEQLTEQSGTQGKKDFKL
jgi:hypothetical protein